MQPDLIVYYKKEDENNSYSSTLIRKKQDLLDIVLANSCWPVFVHVSFNPPLPSKVFESIKQIPIGVYCSSTFSEANFDHELLIDKDVEIYIADLNSYPLIKISGKDLVFDYEDLPPKHTNSTETESEKQFFDFPLYNYHWSIRTTNVFSRYNIRYLSDLLKYSDKELLKLKNFGRNSLQEIKKFFEVNKTFRQNNELQASSLYTKAKEGKIKFNFSFQNLSSKDSNVQLKNFKWSVRTKNILDQFNIETLSDLLKHSEDDFLKIKNFGKNGIYEINEFLRQYKEYKTKNFNSWLENISLRKNQFENNNENNSSHETNLKDFYLGGSDIEFENISEIEDENILGWFESSLTRLKEKQRLVIEKSSGRFSNPMILSEIGNELGRSRERIRQIQKQAIIIMLQRSNVLKSMAENINKEFDGIEQPLSIKYLSQNVESLKGINENQDVFKFIFENFMGNSFFIIKLKEIDYLSQIDAEGIDSLKKEIERYLTSHIGDPISDIREKIFFHFPSRYRCFLKKISEELLSTSALIKDLNGIEILSDFVEKNTNVSLSIKFIKNSPELLSLNQIVNIVQKSEPWMERRSILARLGEDEQGVYPLERGKWGSIQHMNMDTELTENILEICKDFSIKNGKRFFHTKEIIEIIPQSISDKIMLNFYMISALMRENKISNYLGRNLFGPKSSKRPNIKEMIISILERHGKPMEASKILAEVKEVREFTYYQIREDPPIKRFGRGLFGLEHWNHSF